MILAGIKALHRAAGLPVPAGLSRRVSAITTREQLADLLEELWPVKSSAPQQLREAFVSGLLETVPGGAEIATAKEQSVQEQIDGNRYVGIHIQVRYDSKEQRTIVAGIVPGGPADRAGMKPEDRIEQVDGVDTQGMTIAQVVDRLRGADGTEVRVTVRQPGEKAPRTLTPTRGRLFVPSLKGVRKMPSGDWDHRLGGYGTIGYVRLTALSGSTPHELRKVAERLDSEGLRAVIMDLRGLSSMNVHAAVLLADDLLDAGPIGRVREAERVQTYEAASGALFRDLPLAVLVDAETAGAAEWLAAALQDNHRASVVGSPPQSSAPGLRVVDLPGGRPICGPRCRWETASVI